MRSTSKGKKIALAVSAAMVVFALGVCGCTSNTPQKATDADTKAAATEPAADEQKAEPAAPEAKDDAADKTAVGGMVMGSFFDKNAGDMLEDNYTNRELVNAGNRGCNACHEDLADVMGDSTRPALHAIVEIGYGMKMTYKDCATCHGLAGGFYSPYLGDLLHGAHYGNQMFVESHNGNCWSCHAVAYQADGSWDLEMFDDVVHEPTLGGYKDAITNPKSREWVRDHGHGSDYLNGTRTDSDPDMTVELDQRITDAKDLFVVYNYPPDQLDMASIIDPNNTFTLRGVAEEKSYTVEDLKKMPQTTVAAAHECVTNGQGGSMVGNFEYTGVSIADLVEDCGGLLEGMNQANILCYDNWQFAHNALPLDIYMKDAIIAYELNGEPLVQENGAPMLLVLPGMPAGAWGKFIQEVQFSHGDQPTNILTYATSSPAYAGLMNYINAGWLVDDGVEVKLGETVELPGFAWGWTDVRAPLGQIQFSTDGGVTWTDFEIDESYDPNQCVQFTVKWTPKEAGTYVIKVNATNTDGETMVHPIGLFVKVNA